MKGKFALVVPGEMLATMTLTMTVAQWRELRKVLKDVYPAWDLGSLISQLVAKAEQSFDGETEASP